MTLMIMNSLIHSIDIVHFYNRDFTQNENYSENMGGLYYEYQ